LLFLRVILKKRVVLFIVGITLSSLAVAQEKTDSAAISKKDTTVSKRNTALLKRKAIKTAPGSQSDGPKKRTYSKIINDSAKNVYGPKTSKWITESDLFYNKKNYQPLDTAIHNFHRWTYVQRFNNKYQDLGNMGTALNPIFPVVSTTIGATPGFKSYEPYYDTQEPRYYDTKSPFTRLYVIWGGNGRAMSHIEFSRNINPRWNFGFNYRPILVDKQIQQKGKGDRQTVSHYYDFHTTYKSKKDRYFLAVNYRRIRHRIKENGGVLLDKDTTFAGFFDQNAKPYLTTAESEELRTHFHLFHQYRLAKPLQLYQTANYEVRTNTFRIDRVDLATQFFKQTIIDSAKTTDAMEFKTFQNEMGVKGNAAFLFYDFYYKFRTVHNSIPFLKGFDPRYSSSLLEHYVGGKVAFRFDSLSELRGSAELLLDGNYKLEGALATPWLDASLASVLAKPGYLQRAYRGSHNYWLNNFSNTFSNQIKGFLKVRWGNLFVSPGVTYTVLSNYLYFTQFKDGLLPVQSSGNQQIFSPEITMSLRFFRRFYLRPQVIYTQLWKNDDNAIRIPELFANGQLTYENILFNKNLQLQVGVDVHYKSDYQALGYAPDIQSYYLQDKRTVQGYPLVDIFLNAKIKGGRLFVKYHNLMQAGKTSGYMLTYGYPAASNLVDFGFEIPLFD
jgi:Putative porin